MDGFTLRIGDVIWRPARLNTDGTKSIGAPEPKKTERGNLIYRTAWQRQFCTGWIAVSGGAKCGMVVFVDAVPPHNWTKLTVAGVSKGGSAAFAEAEAGSIQELFAAYADPRDRGWKARLKAARDKRLEEGR